MNTECYSRDELLSFALGRLPELLAQQVESHIDLCASCEETVAILDEATDSFLRELRLTRRTAKAASGTETSETAEPLPPEYHEAIGQLQSLAHIEIPPNTNDAPPVELILRDYELLEPLGMGGMGAVFRARHLRLDKLVAVKLLPERRMQDPMAVDRFQREMRLIGQLDHPSIVNATDAGEASGRHFLVMELVHGTDLGRLVRQTGTIDLQNACELVRQAAVGMQHAHDRGIIHRDLKPSNLMLTQDGGLKILDLGLATLASENGTVDELTTMGQLMGTIDYLAPEQLGDCHAVSPAVDVYSLSATLYKLIAGAAPYSGEAYKTPLQKLKGLATDAPIPISQHVADVDIELQNLIESGLRRDPDARIASPTELADRLQPFCEHADLKKLWAERSPKLVSVANQDPLPSVTTTTAQRKAQLAPKPASKDTSSSAVPSRTKGRGLLAVAAGFGGILLLGLLLHLTTNHGTLKIESPRDDLSIKVTQTGADQKTLQLKKGPNTITMALGEYELHLAEAIDDLRISDSKFTLGRLGEHVATITTQVNSSDAVQQSAKYSVKPLLNPPSAPPTSKKYVERVADENLPGPGLADSSGERRVTPDALADSANSGKASPPARLISGDDLPRYADKTFPEWCEIFVKERSPNYRGRAVQAMLALADGADEKKAIDLIYDQTTSRERVLSFSDENTGKASSIEDLVRYFVMDAPQQRVYALLRWIASKPTDESRLALLLKTNQPEQAYRSNIREILLDALSSKNEATAFTAAITALHHESWLQDATKLIRSAQAGETSLKADVLRYALCVTGKANADEVQRMADLVTNEQTYKGARDLGLAGLLMMGPKSQAVFPQLSKSLQINAIGDQFNFSGPYSGASAARRYIYQNYFLPAHLKGTPLVGQDNWGRAEGRHRDAIITWMGCLGPNPKATEVLIRLLQQHIEKRKLTWIASDIVDTRSNRTKMFHDCLVHAIQQTAPEKYRTAESVWVSQLGEKRVPFELERPEGVPEAVLDEIEARLGKALSDLPLQDDYERSTIEKRVRRIHGLVQGNNFHTNENRLIIYYGYREPVACVKTVVDDAEICFVTSRGIRLASEWLMEDVRKSLPTIELQELPATQPGDQFTSKELRGALKIAISLKPIMEKSPISIIRPAPEKPGQFQLSNAKGTWKFHWGHTVREEPIGEPNYKDKMETLRLWHQNAYQAKLDESQEASFDLTREAI